ncbi:uncharacterized protein BJ171DRAFT_116998 [Polychytrium aggregatum]|uniref:uncharacterized protein n=1 Tax=Polychytrium aggregatum TaxID=110093 RepID=UPI0022FF28F8|nr:uncharacterized protein BJ171DRAFT_116998 [Polychytrium aggregatum]KAI9209403.1 hypothetical protein BJ171DRAFT_116998 [Polychytrium aggregatum]
MAGAVVMNDLRVDVFATLETRLDCISGHLNIGLFRQHKLPMRITDAIDRCSLNVERLPALLEKAPQIRQREQERQAGPRCIAARKQCVEFQDGRVQRADGRVIRSSVMEQPRWIAGVLLDLLQLLHKMGDEIAGKVVPESQAVVIGLELARPSVQTQLLFLPTGSLAGLHVELLTEPAKGRLLFGPPRPGFFELVRSDGAKPRGGLELAASVLLPGPEGSLDFGLPMSRNVVLGGCIERLGRHGLGADRRRKGRRRSGERGWS